MKVLSGVNSGRVYDLMPGNIIGRIDADLPLDDPKVSNRHAKIETDENGSWYIADLGSTNGLKIDGKKHSQIVLQSGLKVKIGNSLCEFIEVSNLGWPEYLENYCNEAKTNISSATQRLAPFKPSLTLTITRGPQVGTQWILGYGPRQIGRDALDLHINDPGAPGIVCTLSPKGVSAYFETVYPDKVKLNGRAISAETLKSGDEIHVADTTLLVSYEE